MAHSGGTFFALQAVAQSPESYHAYVAIAQITYQLRSENMAFQYMVKRFQEEGNTRMVRRPTAAQPTMTVPLPTSYMLLRDRGMHSLGIGTTHEMRSVIAEVFLPSWLSRDYTLREKLNIWRGKSFSDRLLWNEVLATDLSARIRGVEIPIYFLHGIHDYTVTRRETMDYFESLVAPVKGFYTFEQSAHSPMLEEPERLRNIIEEDVLRGAARLSDL